MALGLLFIGLVLFVLLVIVHEYGHFRAARRAGVEVEEFGLGFPPRIWGKKLKSKMLLSINALPLGGFVKLKGEHDADTTPGSYGAARLKDKVAIMLAGVAMNLITALGLLTILALVGMPQLFDNQFSVKQDSRVVRQDVLAAYIEPGSPAAKAGIETGDKITGVGEQETNLTAINDVLTFPEATKELAGKTVYIEVSRKGETRTIQATLRNTEEVEASKNTDTPKGYLGVTPTEFKLVRSTWSAPIVAIGTAGEFTWLTLKGIGTALAGLFQGDTAKAASQVSGPVGIFVVLKDGSLLGYEYMLLIIAVISLTLAIMNALPIPALDGGRLFVTLVYKVLRKPLTKQAEERIHGTGFLILMLLFVLITIVDVRRFF